MVLVNEEYIYLSQFLKYVLLENYYLINLTKKFYMEQQKNLKFLLKIL